MKAYVFVDAENHFVRSIAVAKEIVGSSKAAHAIALATPKVPGITGFPNDIEGRRYGWDKELQLFWDCQLLSRGGILTPLGAYVSRAIYACSCTGNDDKVHQMRVRLRKYKFEPIVIREPKDLRRRRNSSLERHKLIEKPKGCDIAIATRMVADAAADLYDCCLLFTSDADFLPAIEAVRNMGKIVWVFGYESALQKRSPYLYVPDNFIDLRHRLQETWRNNLDRTTQMLKELGEPGPFNEPGA